MPRFFVDLPLARDLEAALPSAAARHVQVLRLQPGDAITLFDGRGADWAAQVLRIGRSEVQVRVGEPRPVDRELPVAVTLAVGVPANERMDWLVEKATELGAAAVEQRDRVARLQPQHLHVSRRGGREGRHELAGQGQVDEEARHGSRTGRSRPVCLRLCAESAVRRWTA